ncbi:MAG: TadE/TadG family type IV pilus assembly protein [Acidimicrobiales bacterium]
MAAHESHPRRRGCGHRRDQRGAAMVEFALVLPLLVMLVFGIIEFGRGYNAKITVTAAAREGARLLALGGTADEVRARVRASAPSLDPSLITFNSFTAPCTTGATVEVQASYPVAWEIPIVGGGTWTLQGRGVMRCGG